jgi:hypothetical protein
MGRGPFPIVAMGRTGACVATRTNAGAVTHRGAH